MAEVLYTESALLDLDYIHEYYGRYSRERGDQFSEKLSETIYLLATMPLIGRSRDELLSGLRMFVHERHVIFYTQTDNSYPCAFGPPPRLKIAMILSAKSEHSAN